MSIDYCVYVKNIENFSTEGFFRYASALGVDLRTEEDFAIAEARGFQPFLLNLHFLDTVSSEKTFLSGFEMYTDEHKYTYEKTDKPTFWQKIFNRTSSTLPESSPLSKAVSDAKTVVSVNCSSSDSFEVLLAHIFAAYLCSSCGGILHCPQTGKLYEDVKVIESEIAFIKEELNREALAGELCTHSP